MSDIIKFGTKLGRKNELKKEQKATNSINKVYDHLQVQLGIIAFVKEMVGVYTHIASDIIDTIGLDFEDFSLTDISKEDLTDIDMWQTAQMSIEEENPAFVMEYVAADQTRYIIRIRVESHELAQNAPDGIKQPAPFFIEIVKQAYDGEAWFFDIDGRQWLEITPDDENDFVPIDIIPGYMVELGKQAVDCITNGRNADEEDVLNKRAFLARAAIDTYGIVKRDDFEAAFETNLLLLQYYLNHRDDNFELLVLRDDENKCVPVLVSELDPDVDYGSCIRQNENELILCQFYVADFLEELDGNRCEGVYLIREPSGDGYSIMRMHEIMAFKHQEDILPYFEAMQTVYEKMIENDKDDDAIYIGIPLSRETFAFAKSHRNEKDLKITGYNTKGQEKEKLTRFEEAMLAIAFKETMTSFFPDEDEENE